MRKKPAAEWISAVVFLAAVTAFVCLYSAAILPKRVAYGANWGPFLAEEKNSIDVMFFGSSVVYCDIVPEVINSVTGRPAYVLAGPEQTIAVTYYYVEEMYKTQNPSVVFVEVTGMFYPRYTSYTKANIGYMPWSAARLKATFRAAEREEWAGLLFPPYNYHDRKPEFYRYEPDERRGYTFLSEANGISGVTVRKVNYDGGLYGENMDYLRRIAKLCQSKGSETVFFISPSYGRWEKEYLDMLAGDIRGIGGAAFIDFNERYDDLGLDGDTDYYDFLHLNNSGAVKFTSYMAGMIGAGPATD